MMRIFPSIRRLRHSISGFATPTSDRSAVAVAAETLEPRVLFALAAAAGGSGLSANLSSNPLLRHEQLICDPTTAPVTGTLNPADAPVAGAYGVSYNPALVTLIDVEPATGYAVDYNASQVAVVPGEGPSTDSLGNFLFYVGMGPPAETGYVDVHFNLDPTNGTAGQQSPPTGYNELQEAGVNGFDTFVVTFALLPGVPATLPQYTVFFNPAGLGGPDFLQESPAAGGQTIVAGGPTHIAPVTVGGPPQGLSMAPDPSNPNLNDLFINDNAAASNDNVQVKSAGSSNTGSSGVSVNATLNGVHYNNTYPVNQNNTPFAAVYVLLQNGNDTVQFDNSLALTTTVNAGDGNDNIQLGEGSNTVTLGKGNDNFQALDGANTVTAGNGNDNIHLGNGTDSVYLGDGNDNVQLGNGSGGDNVSLGNGNDNVQLGNGSDDSISLGDGNDNVQLGNGSGQYVFAGNGNDNVQLGNGNGQFVEVGNGNDNVQLGNGSDQFVIAGTGNDNLQFGDGSFNTVFFINGNKKPHVKFGMGSGNSYTTNGSTFS